MQEKQKVRRGVSGSGMMREGQGSGRCERQIWRGKKGEVCQVIKSESVVRADALKGLKTMDLRRDHFLKIKVQTYVEEK